MEDAKIIPKDYLESQYLSLTVGQAARFRYLLQSAAGWNYRKWYNKLKGLTPLTLLEKEKIDFILTEISPDPLPPLTLKTYEKF